VRGPRWVRPPRDGWRSGGEGGEVIGEHREAAGGLIDDPLGLCADAGRAEDDGEVDVAGDCDDGRSAEAVALRQGAHEAGRGGGGGVVVRHGFSLTPAYSAVKPDLVPTFCANSHDPRRTRHEQPHPGLPTVGGTGPAKV